ncbi:MAG: hypothetical protein JO297_18865 [Nitrososphaeraceae archaeon]|nr:hypothetical protein [Nitrososphaeraceae archaeon]
MTATSCQTKSLHVGSDKSNLNCNKDYDNGEKLANQYIIGKDTVCRVRQRRYSTKKKPTPESINDILNPLNRFESRLLVLAEQDSKLNEINDKLTRLADNNDRIVTESSQPGVPDM